MEPEPLLAEIDHIAEEVWLKSQWKWHLGTQLLVLRGGPATAWPGGRLTSGAGVDAPVLAGLPKVRQTLDTALGVPARIAWIGRSPPGSDIRLHIDDTPHWDHHHRVHIALRTTERARLCVSGRFVHMPAGTAWMFNNSAPHGMINEGATRLHLIVDLEPGPEADALIVSGEAVPGERDPQALARLSRDPLEKLTDADRADPERMYRLRQQ
ncbi:MAG: aspartyl/asparaginyl beta-hydroxylase domain-containing protein [Alphaproteobacteria bacterium]|nr:aspartyl/asparaginyl beta-hydroxylase domain-containing protein [Alphaproteobacteria bacterium]